MPCARSMVQSKTFVTPSRCYEKARLDQELKLVGEFGLRYVLIPKFIQFSKTVILVTSVKSGESNWPSPRSEKLPVPFLLLKKKTQRDCLKVMLFSVDWSELVSSQKTKWNSITSSVSKSRTSSKDVSKLKARIIQSSNFLSSILRMLYRNFWNLYNATFIRMWFYPKTVFKLGFAKSIHHARVLIKQRHIRVRKQVRLTTVLTEIVSWTISNSDWFKLFLTNEKWRWSQLVECRIISVWRYNELSFPRQNESVFSPK